ncbi:hypothetical protein ARMGADRAFT_172604 [Armillaria gallica]|uniref:Uncharacterized protein n=1 Tax=Armillaria gallica TaxID=47427 RepID=A0A2H3DUG7_ARMGA|nr:hypothetical protein ARMGADRAFT_172604 [Armillaria gallica]
MYDAFNGLSDMEASVFHHMNYLITACTPFHEEATLVIFEPLRDAVVDFLNPVVEVWQLGALVVSYLADRSMPSWVAGKYRSMRLNAQSARRCFAVLDVASHRQHPGSAA